MQLTRMTIERKAGQEQFQKGLRLYKSGSVTITKADSFWKGETGVNAEVNDGGLSPYRVKLLIKENHIYDYSCSCDEHLQFRGMCRHCAAAALAFLDREMGEPQIHVSTSPLIRNMIKSYGDQKRSLLLSAGMEDKVELEPLLNIGRHGATVGFKAGISRKYILKDLYEFAEAMEKQSYVSYGRSLAFYHRPEAFTEKSAPLAALIVEAMMPEIMRHRNESAYYVSASPSVRDLRLTGRVCDRFFEILDGQLLPMQFAAGQTGNVLVYEQDPVLEVTVAAKGNAGAVLMLPDGIQLIRGEERIYVADRECIYRCSPAYSEDMGVFLASMLQTPYVMDTIADISSRDLPAFCRHVLPRIEPHIKLTVRGINLDEYRRDELKTAFYLDCPYPDEVTLRVEHRYGGLTVNPLDDNTNISLERDYAMEELTAAMVVKYFPNKYYDRGLFAIRDSEDEIYRFLRYGLNELKTIGEVYLSQAAENLKVNPPPEVSFKVAVDSGWLNLEVDTAGLSRSELSEALKSYQQKKKYHRLKNGEFITLDGGGLNTISELSDGLMLSDQNLFGEQMYLPLNRAFYIDSILKESGDTGQCRQSFLDLIKSMELLKDNRDPVPAGLKTELRGYQTDGFHWLKTLDQYGFGGILADDMGLGKTVQMISLLLDHKEHGENGQSLVICPASLVYNWEAEFNQFAPDLTVRTIVGTASERGEQLKNSEDCDVLITSYDLLRKDLEKYREKEFRCQVIDEAQFIKNHSTQSAKAVKQIQAKSRFALTGTPIENRLSELWSIFDYLMPGFLFSYQKFRELYEVPVVKKQDQTMLKRLHRLIGPFVLRRLKQDVLKDLPDKTETVVYSRLTGEQKTLYTANALQLKEMLAGQSDGSFRNNKIQILAELTKLRQLCCDPRLCFDNFRAQSAKLETCMELMHNGVDAGHKILLFSQFTSMLDLLRARMEQDKIRYYLLTGSTSKEERMELVSRFNQDDTPVFLISLKAGGTGLNLTAADIVIHYDPWWNLAAQNQATDRAHRIGQTNVVSVFKLIARHTIEENILKLQEAKRKLAEQVLGGESVNLGSLSREELIEMLS